MRLIQWLCAALLASAIGACAAVSSGAPPASGLRIDGDVRACALDSAHIEALGAQDVEWTHKGRTRTYRAVPLEAILRSVGVTPGEMAAASTHEKRAGWKFAVVATATDGFQAVFSVPEVFHDMGKTAAYVAVSEKDEPLDPSEGPLRLIVTTDGEGSRGVRNLQRLTVLDLRRFVPAQ